jgi:hypothetical protein
VTRVLRHGIRQGEPPSQEADPQHRLQSRRLPPVPLLRVARSIRQGDRTRRITASGSARKRSRRVTFPSSPRAADDDVRCPPMRRPPVPASSSARAGGSEALQAPGSDRPSSRSLDGTGVNRAHAFRPSSAEPHAKEPVPEPGIARARHEQWRPGPHRVPLPGSAMRFCLRPGAAPGRARRMRCRSGPGNHVGHESGGEAGGAAPYWA